ncbi:MAG: cation:proton antiporter [Myxococcota bacterium]
MGVDLLFEAFVFLIAALVVVPLSSRLGLGSVIGYLLAGLLLGPSALGWVGSEQSGEVMHFAEFGVVLMLFLVGLELEPARLWRLRGPILGLGGLQMLVTTGAVGAGAMALGQPWQTAIAIGLIVAMSSTAIGVQSLTERSLLKTDAGQKAFSVLLFQDIAVILILAILPLLAINDGHSDGHSDGGGHGGGGHGGGGHGGGGHGGGGHGEGVEGPLADLTVWIQDFIGGLDSLTYTVVVLVAIVGVIVVGRFVVNPTLRLIATTQMRELFTASALALVVGVTLLMTLAGLSPALGTFLAGVVLANSPFRHELESDIEPFKGLLLGLFFMAVGASIELDYVAAAPGTIAGILGGIVVVKIIILVALGALFKARGADLVHLATALGQIGEFAFVLLSFAASNSVLSPDLVQLLVAVTALSMALSPLLIALGDRVIAPLVVIDAADERTMESDIVNEENSVIIAGFGRFGQIAGRFLRAHGVGVTVLDADIDQIEVLRSFGQKVFYGDASRLDLLHAAGAAEARILIIAVDAPEKVLEIAHTAEMHFPHLKILARAYGRTDAYALFAAGVEHVYRETFDTSLRVGEEALRMLGVPAHRAHRAARTFHQHDEGAMHHQWPVRDDRQQLVRTSRERLSEVENILRLDREEGDEAPTPPWDENMRRIAAKTDDSVDDPDSVEQIAK